jgi:hypothetical protein
VRLYLIYRSRHEIPKQTAQQQQPSLDSDAYVLPKRLYAYDLKSARALIGKPVWVKAGYGAAYYAYNPASRRADIEHQAGSLAPLQKLDIKDVVTNSLPSSAEWQGPPGARFRMHQERQSVLAVFADAGKTYAFPIGSVENGQYHFLIDDLLFIQDPRQLYSHWPPQIWQAIERHQVINGMNETQVSFAVGVPDSATRDSGPQIAHYPNGGHALNVTFDNGRVTSVADAASK